MDKIQSVYDSYHKIVDFFKEDVIESRVNQIAVEMEEFLKEYDLQEFAYINTVLLTHAVMDYFSDIKRLKDYQEIERSNDYKIKGYETYWLLRRKPIQLSRQLKDDKWAFVNEKFLISRINAFLFQDDIAPSAERLKSIKSFNDTLLYYMKFRNCDAQSLELILISFDAGKVFGEAIEQKRNEKTVIP